jgi:hypothetical protein
VKTLYEVVQYIPNANGEYCKDENFVVARGLSKEQAYAKTKRDIAAGYRVSCREQVRSGK